MDDRVVESLRRAIAAAPNDVVLRLQLGGVLLTLGRNTDALEVIAEAVALDPTNAHARELLATALAAPLASDRAAHPSLETDPQAHAEKAQVPAPAQDSPGFDWSAAEREIGHVAAPAFVDADTTDSARDPLLEVPGVKLADVGGMTQVKQRLEASFLAPMRNPSLRALYAKSLRGGMLLYGPPGCGKTFIARALAGELGARFISVGIADVLDPYLGNSERNVHELFQAARREAPCVIFFDEIDALGQRRSAARGSAIRNVVNQLLTELDGATEPNNDVFVLAATNQPWDVDPALRRPGRFDRTLLVLPPDADARSAIFRYHLSQRPVEGIDPDALAARSDGFSGADIAYVCELASETALMDSVATGTPRMISMQDVTAALTQVRPSTGPWLDAARNVVLFGNDDGTYAELRTYLKKMKRL